MTQQEAKTILNYLKTTGDNGLSFCFLVDGRFVTRGDCRKALGIELNLKDYE